VRRFGGDGNDQLSGGAGKDTATLDRIDRAKGCEKVKRKLGAGPAGLGVGRARTLDSGAHFVEA
jgi:hypothetical protein